MVTFLGKKKIVETTPLGDKGWLGGWEEEINLIYSKNYNNLMSEYK